MARIVPSENYRDQLEELIAGASQSTDPVEEIARAGARLILQQSLEDEVTEFLGRERYVRDGEPVGHRNGYEPRKVVTSSGPVELERPRSATPSGSASNRSCSARASPAPTRWNRW